MVERENESFYIYLYLNVYCICAFYRPLLRAVIVIYQPRRLPFLPTSTSVRTIEERPKPRMIFNQSKTEISLNFIC